MKYLIFIFMTFLVCLADSANLDKQPKVFPIVSVIRFPNDPCDSSNGLKGTCYTSGECKDKGGMAGGACADSYGVCCTFSKSCNQRSSENCTYFTTERLVENDNGPSSCKLDICPCDSNICQMRLDFVTFSIAGPSTDTTVVGAATNGVLGAGEDVTAAGQCNQDSFSVTSQGFTSPGPICGVNTNQHMYIDAGEGCECNTLKFLLGTGNSNRDWNIKITQYRCDSPVLPPRGCTQYFYGNEEGMIESYNYNNGDGRQLADQRQNICIRREGNNCRICYTTEDDDDLALSALTGANLPNMCGNYAADGMNANGYDALNIPGGVGANNVGVSRICGNGEGLFTAAAGGTVCTLTQPFNVQVLTDHFEADTEAADQVGVRLSYVQDCP